MCLNGIVLILPMRNGNFCIFYIKFFYRFSFLSYLWGMETWDLFLVHLCVCSSSYPTYEEWKQLIIKRKIYNVKMFLSYLWGMETNFSYSKLSSSIIFRSYPTYEEWKHALGTNISKNPDCVLILPMRNGNLAFLYVP